MDTEIQERHIRGYYDAPKDIFLNWKMISVRHLDRYDLRFKTKSWLYPN